MWARARIHSHTHTHTSPSCFNVSNLCSPPLGVQEPFGMPGWLMWPESPLVSFQRGSLSLTTCRGSCPRSGNAGVSLPPRGRADLTELLFCGRPQGSQKPLPHQEAGPAQQQWPVIFKTEPFCSTKLPPRKQDCLRPRVNVRSDKHMLEGPSICSDWPPNLGSSMG